MRAVRRVGWAVAALLLLMPLARAAPAIIRFSTEMPPMAPVATQGFIPWMKTVEAESGGAVKFQQFWSGQLSTNPTRDFDSLMSGEYDLAALVPAFYLNALPDSSLFGLPGVVRSAEEAAFGGWKMNEAGLLRGMDKLFVVATFSNDPGGLHFARVVRNFSEMRGLKIRVSGPEEAQIVSALGGAPVGMNIADMAEALSRGVYDGTLNGWSANHLYRVTPVLKSHFDLSLGVRQFVFAMPRTFYDRLPAAAQAALSRHRGLALSIAFAHAMESDGDRERAEARRKGTIEPLGPADRAALAAAAKPLVDKWIAATPDGSKKYAFLERALAQYRKGGTQ